MKKNNFLHRLFSIPANVVVLGFVSFLTDVSSDMIYPLLSVFLVQYLGAGQSFVGIVEGIAESTAAFFTLLSGLMADRVRDRSKMVLAGYSLSSFSRPLIALAWNPLSVLILRFFDRMGKGIRTAPRDALIADSIDASERGKAYGFHRSMDHAGAVTGPIVATLLMSAGMTNLRHVFAAAAIPAIFTIVLIIWKVREVAPRDPDHPAPRFSLDPPKGRLRAYLAILFLFILSCSSDAFLLLRANQLGVSRTLLPMIWLVFNLVKAFTTLPFGMLSDRIGRRRIILAGWIIYTGVYIGFGWASQTWHAWALFIFYGLFYGLTEGSERALLVDLAPEGGRGQAFGWYYFIVGLGALPASLLFGWIWQVFGAPAAFKVSAGISAVAAVSLLIFLTRVPGHGRNGLRASLPEVEKD